ncbi:MAG TPA: serine hydrolase [Opitutaceae bacterium]|jgi:CubicO group peptidase (beta-lactamase class C family)
MHFRFACLFLMVTAAGGQDLPRSLPESQGVDSAQVLKLVDAFDHRIKSVNSLMLVRHGRVVAEGWWSPYQSQDVHILYSITKSFVSTAVGFAVQEGRLSVDDRVESFFPDLGPAHPALQLGNMRVRDLLRMSTGHQVDSIGQLRAGGIEWTRTFLGLDVPFKPGTHFLYDSGGAYMLGAIIQRVTGQTVEAYLEPRLFEPLAIRQHPWGLSAEGVDLCDGGLSLRTEDLAKFGQLYLQRGRWDGKQLLSAAWVDAATSLQTSNGSDPAGNWDQGYGYLFWMNKGPGYRADGSLGQFCFVMPKADAVLAVTSGTSDLAGLMDLVWQYLPLALHDAALPENVAGDSRLQTRLRSLVIPGPAGEAHSGQAAAYAGKEYALQPNPLGLQTVALDATPSGPQIRIRDAGGEHVLRCGAGRWERGHTDFLPRISDLWSQKQSKIAAWGAWAGDTTFVADVCFDETPYSFTFRLHWAEGRLALTVDCPIRWEPNLRHLEIDSRGQ